MTKILENENFKQLVNSEFGTVDYHRHPIVRQFLHTDGVEHFAEKFKAYWLIDEIAFKLKKVYQQNIKTGDTFNVVHVISNNNKARIYFQHDTGMPKYLNTEISFTNLEMRHYTFYFSYDGGLNAYVLYLTSEY